MTIQMQLFFPKLTNFIETLDNHSLGGSQPFWVDGMIRGMTAIIREITRLSRLNAPVKTGALRRSIEGYIGPTQVAGRGSNEAFVETAKGRGGTAIASQLGAASRLDGRISVGAFYGFLVHENLGPFGTGVNKGKPYRRKSGSKGSQHETGGKFVERAVATVQPRFAAYLTKALQEAFFDLQKSAKFKQFSRGSKLVQANVAATNFAKSAVANVNFKALVESRGFADVPAGAKLFEGKFPGELGFGSNGDNNEAGEG